VCPIVFTYTHFRLCIPDKSHFYITHCLDAICTGGRGGISCYWSPFSLCTMLPPRRLIVLRCFPRTGAIANKSNTDDVALVLPVTCFSALVNDGVKIPSPIISGICGLVSEFSALKRCIHVYCIHILCSVADKVRNRTFRVCVNSTPYHR